MIALAHMRAKGLASEVVDQELDWPMGLCSCHWAHVVRRLPIDTSNIRERHTHIHLPGNRAAREGAPLFCQLAERNCKVEILISCKKSGGF